MRRSALVVALLLATAPVANATEVTPNAKPDLRAVEVAAPSIREDIKVAPVRPETRSTKASTVQQVNLTNVIIIALVVIGILALVSAI